jgi:hypothetical protein
VSTVAALRSLPPLLLGLLLTPAIALVAGPLAADPPRTLVADLTLLPDGTLAPGRAVLLDDEGRIRGVTLAEGKELPAPVRRFGPGSVLAPGLHELLSGLGSAGERTESVRLFDVEADGALAIDPLRRDLDRARRAGILHATVAPAPRNPVSGIAATFLTGARPALSRLGGDADPVIIAVGESALDPLREPTSRSGLQLALAEWLDGPGERVLARRAAPLVHCGEAMDVRAALELFARGPAPTLVIEGEALECAEILARAAPARRPALVVVGPYEPETPPAEIAGAAALARAGVEIAMRGALPEAGADAIRDAARRAVGHGLDPAAARRALTVNPARAVGHAGEIGSIEPGRRADLVVYSGDPLLPGSTVAALFQGGDEVPLPPPAPRSGPPAIPEIPVHPPAAAAESSRELPAKMRAGPR